MCRAISDLKMETLRFLGHEVSAPEEDSLLFLTFMCGKEKILSIALFT